MKFLHQVPQMISGWVQVCISTVNSWRSGQPLPLQLKMGIGIGALGVFAGGLCAAVLWFSGISQLDRKIDAKSKEQAKLITKVALDAIISEDRPALQTVVSGLEELDIGLEAISIHSELGSELASWNHQIANQDLVLVKTPIDFHGQSFGLVSMSWSKSHFAQPIYEQIFRMMMAIIATTILIIVSCVSWVHWFIVQPLQFLEGKVEAVAEMTPHPAPPRDYNTREIKSLIRSLDQTSTILSERTQRDIELATQRSRAETAENTAKAKMEFLSLMSHEIRTPLSAVLGFTDLLRPTKLTREQRSYVNQLGQSGDFLLHIINDILDLSKIEAEGITLEEKPFSMKSLTDELIAMLHPKAEHQNIFLKSVNRGTNRNVQIMGDRHRLKQVLMNLAGNAIKFTKQGGVTVHLNTALTPEKGNSKRGKCDVEFTVKDTGIGMNQEQADNIFQPFSQADGSITREFGGTGLGLTIAQGLVEKMGGVIVVKSEVSKGSTFQFSVTFDYEEAVVPKKEPRSTSSTKRKASKNRARTSEKPAPINLPPLRILVAEDAPVNRMLVTKLMSTFGQKPDFAEDGQQAIDILKEKNDYDVVFLDLRMPNVDGTQVATEIRAGNLGPHYQDVPIAMLSADVLAMDECEEIGVDDFISKPISIDALKHFLDRVHASDFQTKLAA